MTHDTASVEAIYRAFQPKVSAYVRSRASNAHDAEELVSAVFFKVMQKASTYAPQRPRCPPGCIPSPATR